MSIERRIRFFKEPVSAGTHFAGFLAGLVGLAFLAWATRDDPAKHTGMWIYGSSLCLLFFASSVYHFVDAGREGNRWLQRFDHTAIFLLIGGSYVPPLLHLLDGGWRIGMLVTVGVLAALGMLKKLVWLDAPTWLSTASYLVLGWIIVIPAPLMFPQMSGWALGWLALGGVAYSVGALVYLFRWPDPWPKTVGHHEVWHVFVLAGAAAHFVFMVWLIDVPRPPFA